MRALRDLFQLKGSVALVTGGAGHVGLACLEALAELGADLIVVDREAVPCDARAKDLARRFGVRTRVLEADLERPDICSAVIHEAKAFFGRLDILINNAAYTGASGLRGWAVPFPEQTVEAWEAALRVNLTAPFILAQSAFEELAKNDGVIINVGSIYGTVGPQPDLYAGTAMANPAAYGASKGGLVQLTRYLATIMAPRVRVNCISPGGIERGQPAEFCARYRSQTPLNRMATEEDLKGAFAFLASKASGYVTGQNLLVDGGWTTW